MKTVSLFMNKESLNEFIRFCVVGVLATILDAAIFYTVRTFAPYQIALASGYLLSLVFNYFLTVRWTFKKQTNIKNAIGLVSAHLFNLFVVRMGLMFIFVDMCSINDKIAYIPTLGISMFTNFIIIKIVLQKLS